MFELNDDTKRILGMPNFTCSPIANRLRAQGHDIPKRSEDEQAHTLYYLLCKYEEYGDEWLQKTNEDLKKDTPQRNQ